MKISSKIKPIDSALTSYFIGFLNSLVVAVAISTISKMPSRYAFSALFGALTFLIYYLLVGNRMERSKSRRINKPSFFDFHVSREIQILTIYAVSLLLVILIPPVTESQFADWTGIPAISYVRLVAGLLLSSMLPGYCVLRLIIETTSSLGWILQFSPSLQVCF